jgi:hypothetical protein
MAVLPSTAVAPVGGAAVLSRSGVAGAVVGSADEQSSRPD